MTYHPFDLNQSDIASLKTYFPEFKKFIVSMGGGSGGSPRSTKEGVDRDFFKMKMKEAMPYMSMDQINKIVMRVDTRSDS